MSAAHPSGRPSGIRKLGTGSLRAESLLDAYAKRSAYPSRTEAAGAFKRAAPFLGHHAQAVTLVDYLISLTQAQDWQGGPITVWPSNGRLCHVFGAVERTIQVQLAGTAPRRAHRLRRQPIAPPIRPARRAGGASARPTA